MAGKSDSRDTLAFAVVPGTDLPGAQAKPSTLADQTTEDFLSSKAVVGLGLSDSGLVELRGRLRRTLAELDGVDARVQLVRRRNGEVVAVGEGQPVYFLGNGGADQRLAPEERVAAQDTNPVVQIIHMFAALAQTSGALFRKSRTAQVNGRPVKALLVQKTFDDGSGPTVCRVARIKDGDREVSGLDLSLPVGDGPFEVSIVTNPGAERFVERLLGPTMERSIREIRSIDTGLSAGGN